MITATHPPIFLPWPGLFCKALAADTLVLLDAVQFPLGRGWMTRNRLKSDQGELWLHVPVYKKGRSGQLIRDVELCNDTNWREKHLRSIEQYYAHAPYLGDYMPEIERIYRRNQRRLLDLNVELIQMMAPALGVRSRVVLQSELGVKGTGTRLLTSVCNALGSDTYAALPPAGKYLDPVAFDDNEIALHYVAFRPPVYPQLWGDFIYNLSALDLLLTCGPKGADLIAGSCSPRVG